MNFMGSTNLNLAQILIFMFPTYLTGAHQVDNRHKQYININYYIVKKRKKYGHNQK